MAESLGPGHETYSSSPAASFYIPADLVAAANCAASLDFPPPAAVGDYCYRPDYYYSPPPLAFPGGAAQNEINMCCGDVDGRMMVSRSAGSGGGRPSSRIGFRTRSEVDVLDDGFKWRKYGKKAVKSSPNPRNYYRCSAEGCGVKKRVERDRDDPRYVLTTYDGVHNHAAPGSCHPAPPHGASPPAMAYTAPPSVAAPSGGGVATPCDAWGTMQLQAVVHSSESSY